MTNESFRFLTALAPRIDARDDSEVRYVETSASRAVGFVFAGRAVPEATTHARAVAGWTRYPCGRAVLLVCNPDEPAGNLNARFPFDAARLAGRGIALRPAAGPWPFVGAGLGDAAWAAPVTCDPVTDTCIAHFAIDDLRAALGRVDAAPACRDVAPSALPATLGAVAAALNTRLDIYPEGEGPADDPAYQPSPNSLTGLVPAGDAPPGACDFSVVGGGALEAPALAFAGPGRHPPHGAEPLDHMGYPRDNCAYPALDGGAPPDNCIAVAPPDSGLPTGSPLGTGLWDLPAYLAFHHPGIGFESAGFNRCAGGGCRLGDDGAVDLDGDGRLSRWEVYRWELGGHPPAPGRTRCFADGRAGLPLPPFDPALDPDRRLLGALIVNCGAVAAAPSDSGVPLAGGDPAAALFLSEAAGELSPDLLYGEFVAPSAIGAPPVLSVRDRLVLRE